MIEKKFLKRSIDLANIFSKDPSTKVGCLIFDPQDRSVISRGYNGMPRGFDDADEEKLTRPLKYSYFEHAERNAIYNAIRPYFVDTIALLTGVIDTSCTRALIACGISIVCFPKAVENEMKESVSLRLLKDAKLHVFFCTDTTIESSEDVLTKRQKTAILNNFRYLTGLVKELARDPYAVGCAIFSPDTLIEIAQGYSDLVRGAKEDNNRYEGQLRHYWVEGAVRNTIFNLVRQKKIFKEKVAAVSATSCFECARALISCEIAEIVAVQPSEDMNTRWKDNFDQTRQMCSELGTKLVEIPIEDC